jgi:trk system potassium uptake protein TrkA
MNIIIVGGGMKVHFLAKSFIAKGYATTIINDDIDYCKKLARKHQAKVVYGDGSLPNILEDAGVEYCDAVIAITPDDPTNLAVCQLAMKIYEVPKTLSIANDPNNIDIFKKLGVSTVISTAEIISSLIEQRVMIDDLIDLMPLEGGKVSMLELEVKTGYPVSGKRMQELNFPEGAMVSCIIRNGDVVIPFGKTMVQDHDRLIILYEPPVRPQVFKIISGSETLNGKKNNHIAQK